jgi:hypothetical protein
MKDKLRNLTASSSSAISTDGFARVLKPNTWEAPDIVNLCSHMNEISQILSPEGQLVSLFGRTATLFCRLGTIARQSKLDAQADFRILMKICVIGGDTTNFNPHKRLLQFRDQ